MARRLTRALRVGLVAPCSRLRYHNTMASSASFPALAAEAPQDGAVQDVRPGLRWLRMPLPFPPRHVNLWLLRDGPGWLLIDTGAHTARALALWQGAFLQALEGKPITRVLVTHFHPDHVGLAGEICARFGAPLLMPRVEYLNARLHRVDLGLELVQQQLAFAAAGGCPPEYLRYLTAREPLYGPTVVPPPRSYQRIAADDTITIDGAPWRVMIGEGHAPEMACLYAAEQGLLIAADQVLLRISPYIGVHAPEPEGDPLGDFLRSNRQFLDLPRETLVLPSHGEPFWGLHERVQALSAHHQERLATLHAACGGAGLTGYEAMRVLFTRPLDWHQTGFALGETLAHLHRLRAEGRLVREAGAGVYRYRALG